MVEKLKNLIRKIESQKGVIALFMLWKDSQDITKWTVVVSANWIDRMSKRAVLDYLIKNLQSTLNKTELNEISRISILKTSDNFVKSLTRILNISGGTARFTQNQIGHYYIHDAVIFEAKGFAIPNAPIGTASRNPAINGTINPNINGTINPNINGTINPNINGTINPNINGTINPNINGTINPSLNWNFSGLILYDLSLSKTAYFIEANDNILLMFDFGNNFAGFCVKAKIDFYNVFDVSNNWIGYLVSNKKSGFNYFSTNAQWIGFVI